MEIVAWIMGVVIMMALAIGNSNDRLIGILFTIIALPFLCGSSYDVGVRQGEQNVYLGTPIYELHSSIDMNTGVTEYEIIKRKK